MVSRRSLLTTSASAITLASLAACSKRETPTSDSSQTDIPPEELENTLIFRLWDESAKAAYEKSFAVFTEKTGIKVVIEVVGWEEYWQRLPLDLSLADSPQAPDVVWLNSASFTQLQQAGYLVNITETLKPDTGLWEKAVVDLYTREGALWGIPQIWDSIALFYNKNLLAEAGIDPSTLSFNPAVEHDALRDTCLALVRDFEGRRPGDEGYIADNLSVYGFNSMLDRQAILGPFLASNGAALQDADGRFTFASAEGIAAIEYLVNLVNGLKVAPSAADTNANPRYCRELFTQGKLAMFQSGPYSVKPIFEGVDGAFEWALAPLIAGPAGAKSVVHGVVAAGNAQSGKQEQIKQLLEWLGTVEGQRELGAQGISFPGHKDAQSTFIDYWAEQGVDVQQFIAAAENPVPSDLGSKAVAGLTAIMPILQQIFTGELAVAEGLTLAQDTGNEAMA